VLEDPGVRAKACFSAGHLILPLRRTAEARRWIQESLELYRRIGYPGGVVMAQSMLGEVAAWSGSYDEARELGEASVAMGRSLNDPWLLAWVLCRFGMIFFYKQEEALSRTLLEESLRIFEQLGDPLQVGDHLITLGALAYSRGDLSEASAYYQKALTNALARQSKWTEVTVLRHLGMVAYEKGEYPQMRSFLRQSVLIQRENVKLPSYGIALSMLGSAEINLAHPGQALRYFKESLQISTEPYDIVSSLIGIARAALQTNQPRIAAQLLGACLRHIQLENKKLGRVVQKEYERGWGETKTQLEEPAFAQAISAGQAMSLEEAVAYALALPVLNRTGGSDGVD
jgi:tetratricopeptide (TPR) repeat protein